MRCEYARYDVSTERTKRVEDLADRTVKGCITEAQQDPELFILR